MHESHERRTFAVHALRASVVVDVELEWFFNRAECDMGIRSNFERAMRISDPQRDAPNPESLVDAAHAYRQIRGWLRAIPDSDAGVLQAAYEIRPWPPELYDELGRLTGIVVRLACAHGPWPAERLSQERVEMAMARLLASDVAKPVGLAPAPLARLRREAEPRLSRAHRAYSGVRGVRRCVVSGW
jgi:hypothetical protein